MLRLRRYTVILASVKFTSEWRSIWTGSIALLCMVRWDLRCCGVLATLF